MSKKLNEKKNDLITRAEEVLNKAKVEERELTEEESKELEQIRSDVAQIDKTIEMQEAFEKMEKREIITEEKELTEEEKLHQREIDEEQSFENYIRGQIIHERVNNLTKSDNGAVIPTTIANRIIKKVYDICPVLERSDRYNVKGNLDLPYYDETTNALTVDYQTEFTAMTSSGGKFLTVNLTGFLAGALTKISRSLINNTQFDIVNFVINHMAEAIKSWIEKELLNGTANKITGLSTLTNKITAASATAVTADEVIKLHDAVKDVYQQNAIWVMSSATRTALRLLKDDNKRYLLNDDVSSPFGTSMLGKPVYVSDNMPDMAAGKTAIYYGDMKGLATKFSENINIDVLREKYADEHAVGVIGWFEFDGKVVNEQMIAKLVMKSA